MVQKVTIMMYVDNVDASISFWQTFFNFTESVRFPLNDSEETIVLSNNSQVDLQFFNKEFIKNNSPEVSLETPSLIFDVANFDSLHQDLSDSPYFVGDIIGRGSDTMFNFSDNNEQYFVVRKEVQHL